MAAIVHVSDLHLFQPPAQQALILESLVAALAGAFRDRGGRADLLALTGDVFTDSGLDPDRAIPRLRLLLDAIDGALGGKVPTVILPGNHDRRSYGVIGPNRDRLFCALADALAGAPHVFVHGTTTPLLGAVVPAALHGLAAHVIALDSTFLPTGLLGAGGRIRQADLLACAAALPPPAGLADVPTGDLPADDAPLFLLTHHHLVPTPITDMTAVGTSEQPARLRFAIDQLLPRLVANGNHEELMMTALGAGTALSTLQLFGRAVAVLHGHKHFPAARLLHGVGEGENDVLLLGAGSAGVAEPVSGAAHPAAAHIWPSFNIYRLEADRLAGETWAFSDARPGDVRRRPLFAVRRAGPRFTTEPAAALDGTGVAAAPPLLRNESICTLVPAADPDRYDLLCRRLLLPDGGWERPTHDEVVTGLPGARVRLVESGHHHHGHRVPAHLPLPVGLSVTYRMTEGLCRTASAAARFYDAGTAFEWVGLLERFGSRLARLVLENPPLDAVPFASLTDLTTGVQRPARLHREGNAAVLEVRDCPPRTQLRIYWPLQPAP